jgi:hypothetical protein
MRKCVSLSIVVLINLLFFVFAYNAKSAEISDSLPPKLTENDLKIFIPEDYELDKFIERDFNNKGYSQYILAMSETKINKDRYDINNRPVILFYLDWDGKWKVNDSIMPHVSYYTHKQGGANITGGPNYVKDLKIVKLGNREIIYFKSEAFAGGSGGTYFLDFYVVENRKLKLLKTFALWSQQPGYACFYNTAFYYAKDFNIRGEKKGKSYVYTCYLEVSKYSFDGNNITLVGTELMREK